MLDTSHIIVVIIGILKLLKQLIDLGLDPNFVEGSVRPLV
jgi:hypothetical protein